MHKQLTWTGWRRPDNRMKWVFRGSLDWAEAVWTLWVKTHKSWLTRSESRLVFSHLFSLICLLKQEKLFFWFGIRQTSAAAALFHNSSWALRGPLGLISFSCLTLSASAEAKQSQTAQTQPRTLQEPHYVSLEFKDYCPYFCDPAQS